MRKLGDIIASLPAVEQVRIAVRTEELIRIEEIQQAAAAKGEELLGRPVPMIGGSFNSRTSPSEGEDVGANPTPPANTGDDDEGSRDASPSGGDPYDAACEGGS